MNIKGVITGDIVSSTAIPLQQRETLLAAMQGIADDLKSISDLQIEFFRGDSFQLLVHQPEHTLRLALLFRAGLMRQTPAEYKQPWDARVAIGIGEVSFLQNNIVVSDGEAFQLSGRGLDELKKNRLAVHTPWPEVNAELAVSTAFADEILMGWTPPQAEATYHQLLHNITQRQLAEQINKSPQTVSKLLSSAKLSLIELYLRRFEQIIFQITLL